MKKKTVQDVHIMERMPEKGGCRKVLTKHSAGSIKVNVEKDRFFIMVSLFKEQCRKDEKPGWKKRGKTDRRKNHKDGISKPHKHDQKDAQKGGKSTNRKVNKKGNAETLNSRH